MIIALNFREKISDNLEFNRPFDNCGNSSSVMYVVGTHAHSLEITCNYL